MIASLHASSMTVSDTAHHLSSAIGTELSRETFSWIIAKVHEEALADQPRSATARGADTRSSTWTHSWPRENSGGFARNEAAHIEHVPGIWVQAAQDAKLLPAVCTAIVNCGGPGSADRLLNGQPMKATNTLRAGTRPVSVLCD